MLESTKKVRSFSPVRLLSTSDGFILVLLLTMLYCPQLQAQRAKTFVGADGGEGMSIQQTSDGGYVLTGQMGNDVLVLRLDSNGNIPGCTYLSNANVTENVASFATNNINSTVTDLSQSMVGVNVTVKTPSFAVNTICP